MLSFDSAGRAGLPHSSVLAYVLRCKSTLWCCNKDEERCVSYSTEVLEYAALRGHGDHEKKKPYYAALFHAV